MLNLAVTPVEKRDPSTVILLKKYLTEANITSIDPENVSLKDIKEMRKTADKAAKQYPLKTRIYAKTQEIKKKRPFGQGFMDNPLPFVGATVGGVMGIPGVAVSCSHPENIAALSIGAVGIALVAASVIPHVTTNVASNLTEPKSAEGKKIYQDYKTIRDLQKALKKVKGVLNLEAKALQGSKKEAKKLKSATFWTADDVFKAPPTPKKGKVAKPAQEVEPNKLQANQKIVQEAIKKRQQVFGK